MGTKVHCESLFLGYNHHSMRDLNTDSNGYRLPLFLIDNKTSENDHQSHNGFPSHTIFKCDKDVVRKTMLDHETVFKTQVMELHRVYRTQKEMMDELKRKQLNIAKGPFEASFSSQATTTTTNDEYRRWKMPSFPLANSVNGRPSMSVVEDNGHSPMKGSNSQGVVGSVPWLNGASSKNVETLETRPTKIRKKMIDLCLPADDYIDDTEEIVELKDHRLRIVDVNTESQGDSSRFGYGLSSRSNVLADLNEPCKAQETNELAYGLSHDLRNSEFQAHLRGYRNSGSVREHAPVPCLHPNENGKQKVWLHQPLSKGTPFLQPEKPLGSSSHSMQVFSNNSQRVIGLPTSVPPNKAVFWRERTFIDLEADDTDTNSLASHQPRHFYPYNPLDSAVPWKQLNSPRQNPSFGFPQKLVPAQRYPSDTMCGNAQKQGCLGDRLQFESNYRFNSGCGNSIRSNHNIFYNEGSSSSKPKFHGTGYKYTNVGRSDYNLANPLMGSNNSEMKVVRDLNLNVTLSNTSAVEVRKDEENVDTLPWLVKAQSNAEQDKVHKVMMFDINEPCDPLSDEDQQAEEHTETKVSGSNRCQIDLNMSVIEDEDVSWSVPTSSRLNSKASMIDLETPAVCESDDDYISAIKPSEETSADGKTLYKPSEFEKLAAETIVDISSACLDRELEVVTSREASETMILHWFAETVYTHNENLDRKLDIFSRNQVCSIEEIDYFESMTLQLPEITEEEYMPKPLVPEDLKFEETSGAAVATSQRPRRGNARKGKQRRDFQRDILPGLLSLSKHEVTEDIHMFDGLMRAAGSSWTPAGLSRKKTGTRGRPRRVITIPEPVYCPVPALSHSIQHHSSNQSNNCVEDRSFTGWGKMTRRPRRQRCPLTTSNQRSSPYAPFT
ncbi:unnamed protein product [Cochlearia groenlandica]